MASKSPVVTVHFESDPEKSRKLRRMFPAAFASMLMHGICFALIFFLTPSPAITTPIEPAHEDTMIAAEPILETKPALLQDIELPFDIGDKIPEFPAPGPSPFPGPGPGPSPAPGPFPAPAPGPGPGLGMPGEPSFKDRIKGAINSGMATSASEAAVARGLKWLVRVQMPDGKWILEHPAYPDKGQIQDDAHIAATAFGLLPFFAAGKTHKPAKDNPYDKPIEKGINYLLSRQSRKTGYLGNGEKATQNEDHYAHGLATIALCECYGLTQDPKLRRPAQMALNYLISVQHSAGGWRYRPGEAGDLSVSGWQIMALKSGLMAGLDIPFKSLAKSRDFVSVCCIEANEGYSYTPETKTVTPAMTAVALLCRQYHDGWGPQNKRLITAIDNHLLKNPPQRNAKNIYYTYYATQVMHHFGGEEWKEWNQQMRDLLVASQDKQEEAPTRGSWSSLGDPWGRRGGRLMQTSLSLLTLEVSYRYLPLYQREAGFKNDAASK